MLTRKIALKKTPYSAIAGMHSSRGSLFLCEMLKHYPTNMTKDTLAHKVISYVLDVQTPMLICTPLDEGDMR